jgi:aryl-alcohol dehydrogenase-like predicted oxidoreductase
MEKRQLGRTDLMVTSCCLGTMTWGKQNNEAEGHAQIDMALDHGVNFMDTAEIYAIPPSPEVSGKTEEIIGTWLKTRGGRDKWVIASKAAGRSVMTWLRDDGGRARLVKSQIDEAVAKSLRRLQTDYIDLYQLHWPDRRVPLFGEVPAKTAFQDEDYEPFDAILEALDAHIKAGRIRHVGVSNETPWGVMRFLLEAERRGLPRIVSIQNAYNTVNRTFERGLSEIALREQVGLLAYSPLAQGYLTGKYLGGARPPGARTTLFERGQRYQSEGAEEALQAHVDAAADLGVDPAKLAIRFCDTRPFMTSTIIGATTMEQLAVALDAFDLPWTDAMEEAVARIEAKFRSPCP